MSAWPDLGGKAGDELACGEGVDSCLGEKLCCRAPESEMDATILEALEEST